MRERTDFAGRGEDDWRFLAGLPSFETLSWTEAQLVGSWC